MKIYLQKVRDTCLWWQPERDAWEDGPRVKNNDDAKNFDAKNNTNVTENDDPNIYENANDGNKNCEE